MFSGKIDHNDPSSFWRQSLVGMTFASWAIDDDHCARIHASARSRRFGRFVRDALAELFGYDRHRQCPVADFARDQQDGANIGPLVLASVGSGTRLPIDVGSSD